MFDGYKTYIMEIMNQNEGREKQCRAAEIWKRNFYLGIVLITIGLIWLLHNFDIIGERFFDLFFSWQTLLIVIGGYLLSIRRWIGGGIVLATGVVFLLTDFFGVCIPVNKIILPIIFMVAGLAVILGKHR